MSTHASPEYNATVIGREEINPQLIILRVQPENDSISFVPGQFAVLGLLAREERIPESYPEEGLVNPDKMIRRAYSIASSSVERRYLEFYLSLVSSGELTPRLFALRIGSRLHVAPRVGGFFTLDRVAPEKSVLLISTGTGLAPYISMLRTMLIHDSKRRFVVLHGARYSWDLGYRAELESLSRIRPNLVYIPAITRPGEDPHFTGQTGRIQNLLEQGVVESLSGLLLDPAMTDVFLCGNPEMIRKVKSMMLARGFIADSGKESGTLHVEEYW